MKGKIENSEKQLIATFSSVYNGMGTVWVKPEMNERYTAVLDNGLTFRMPIPRQSGTQLQIINEPGSDSVAVMIDASPDLYNNEYLFRARAKGISCAMGIVRGYLVIVQGTDLNGGLGAAYLPLSIKREDKPASK